MADSNSPAFVPPVNAVKDNDPMVVRVPLDKTDFGARMSSQKAIDTANSMTVNNLKNGQ